MTFVFRDAVFEVILLLGRLDKMMRVNFYDFYLNPKSFVFEIVLLAHSEK